MDKVGAGIVLTGGSALMPNLGQLIKYRTGLDVRKGIPRLKLNGQWKDLEDPRNATVLGLLKAALNDAENESSKEFFLKKKKKKTRPAQPGFFSQMKKEVTRQVTLFFDEEQDTEMF